MESYLTDHKQFVQIDNKCDLSAGTGTTRGPQCSPLGPLQLIILLWLVRNCQRETIQLLFFCLTINEHPNWKGHIDSISDKISKHISMINRLKHFLSLKTKTLSYYSFTVSHNL